MNKKIFKLTALVLAVCIMFTSAIAVSAADNRELFYKKALKTVSEIVELPKDANINDKVTPELFAEIFGIEIPQSEETSIKFGDAIEYCLTTLGLNEEEISDNLIKEAKAIGLLDNVYGSIEYDLRLGQTAQLYVNFIKIGLAAPTSSAEAGTYTEPITVELSCENDDAEILYTIDGTSPKKGIKYTESLKIEKTAKLRAICVSDGIFGTEAEWKYVIKRENKNNIDYVMPIWLIGLLNKAPQEEVYEITASGQCGDKVYWELNEIGHLRIYGEGPMWDYSQFTAPWYEYDEKEYFNKVYQTTLSNGDTIGRSGYGNGYNDIKTISIEHGVTTVGKYAFYYSFGVESVKFANTVESINTGSFANCYELKEIVLNNGLKSIKDGAFNRCLSLTTIDLPNTLIEIRPMAFYDAGLTTINVPVSVTYIGQYAFCNNFAMESATCPIYDNDIIGYNNFDNCINLKEVTLIGSDEYLGSCIVYEMFKNCKKLEAVTINGHIDKILGSAFSGCEKLRFISFDGSDAPLVYVGLDESAPLSSVPSTAKVLYLAGTSGWTNPWHGLTAIAIENFPD